MLNSGATFRCLLNGQTVTFIHHVDIDSMKGHPDYERMEEEETVAIVEEPVKKALGRPKKTETTSEEV